VDCLKRREDGFTITEVLVAILILSIGAMTTFGLLSSATRNAQRAKASQVALEFAEQEMELLRSTKDEKLALTAAPAPSPKPLNPDYRVSGGSFALSREPLGNYRNLVLNGGSLYGGGSVAGGTVSPGPTPFTSGDVSGMVYRYIVWHNDESCSESKCPGKQDYKQIVVAVRVNSLPSQGSERGYFEVQSNFVNPTDSAENDPIPNSEGKVVTAQQFFLTDTVCAATPPTVRQEIVGDHLLHNTLGTCASGPQTGTILGAPDALTIGSPPDPAPEDPTNPPFYDYSDDPYLEPNPNSDKGVQIRRDDHPEGCHFESTGKIYPEGEMHRWVTDPMAESFVMTEKVTLEFYTRSLSDESLYHGTLCVFLFKRHEVGPLSLPVATDTLLTNRSGGTPYWTFTPPGNEYWPHNGWAKERLTMTFNEAPYTIPAGDRLGVALTVEHKNTEAEAIPILYDHPNFPSRIEVDTSTPINGG
jgi:prepilin-type N-terminal cleavage/methylation domain-containing protein